MRFYLGIHRPNWLATIGIPLFVSRRVLHKRKTFPQAAAPWVLDSGGFTELNMYGEWQLTTRQYAKEVQRFQQMGRLEWAAPMDWMCEPSVIAKTGLTVPEHQRRTVDNYLDLRERCGAVIAPVLQGWEIADYHRCVDLYELAGVDLSAEPIVGVGSVCRRGATADVSRILRTLHDRHGLRLHGFGIKGDAAASCADFLASADSMAWSFTARNSLPHPGCTHKSCSNCLVYALRWYRRQLDTINRSSLRLWSAA